MKKILIKKIKKKTNITHILKIGVYNFFSIYKNGK